MNSQRVRIQRHSLHVMAALMFVTIISTAVFAESVYEDEPHPYMPIRQVSPDLVDHVQENVDAQIQGTIAPQEDFVERNHDAVADIIDPPLSASKGIDVQPFLTPPVFSSSIPVE